MNRVYSRSRSGFGHDDSTINIVVIIIVIIIIIIFFFDPCILNSQGMKKIRYALQKSSWNEPYSSSFTILLLLFF